MALVVPASAGDVRDVGAVPGFGRSPGGGHGSPLQYLAWRTPWTEEPAGYSPWGHNKSDMTAEISRQHVFFVFSLKICPQVV